MGHFAGAISQERLDEQRGVVQNEKRQGENQPYAKAFDLIPKATYPANHPYSWTVIGEMEDLNAASLEDVKEWFRTYYGTANAVLSIAGDVEAEEVHKLVEKYFGDIPSGPPIAKHEKWIAKRTGSQRQTMQDRVPRPAFIKFGMFRKSCMTISSRSNSSAWCSLRAKPAASTIGSFTRSRSLPT
jgi:zinc protease